MPIFVKFQQCDVALILHVEQYRRRWLYNGKCLVETWRRGMPSRRELRNLSNGHMFD